MKALDEFILLFTKICVFPKTPHCDQLTLILSLNKIVSHTKCGYFRKMLPLSVRARWKQNQEPRMDVTR
jgi:hypothetical protein